MFVPETKVKELVRKWLNDEAKFEFVQREFQLKGGKIDFLAARWTDDGWQLDIVGVECKGQITVANISGIVTHQLNPFAESVPKIYLACSMPREKTVEDIRWSCRNASVGVLGAANEIECLLEPPNIHPQFKKVHYINDVRSRVAMFMEFQRKFVDELGLRIHPAGARIEWVSTSQPLDRPQWNAFLNPEDAYCFLGVNIEKANRLLRSGDIHTLRTSMVQLPADARCDIERVRFVRRNQRKWLPIRRASAHIVAEELEGFPKLVHTLDRLESLALTVSFPLWRPDEVAGRPFHRARLEKAYEVLKPLCEAIGGHDVA